MRTLQLTTVPPTPWAKSQFKNMSVISCDVALGQNFLSAAHLSFYPLDVRYQCSRSDITLRVKYSLPVDVLDSRKFSLFYAGENLNCAGICAAPLS